MNIVIGILIFLLLILIHEFGHFIIAKRVGIKVNEFSIGMGPALWKKQSGETLYALRAFPIGGYCAMEGEDEDSLDPRRFDAAGPWQRMAVIFAGAGFNFLSAYLVLLIIGAMVGSPVPVIGAFTEISPAQEAGLEIGDRILSIDDMPIREWEDISIAIAAGQEDGKVVVVYSRQGKEDHMEIPLIEDKTQVLTSDDAEVDSQSEVTRRFLIGIVPERQRSVISSFKNANTVFFSVLGSMFSFLKQLFRGGVGLKDVGGPVAVVGMIGQAVNTGLYSVLMFFSFLAINLGFFNLLPFPALDGGRILLILIEIVRGKALPKEKEGMLNLVGMGFLMLLMVVVLFNDIVKLIR